MRIIYIAHAIGGDVQANLADLYRIARRINMEYPDIVPFAPYVLDVLCLNDAVPAERARGIANNTALLQSGMVEELWLTGNRISAGMKAEMGLAKQMGIAIIDQINVW